MRPVLAREQVTGGGVPRTGLFPDDFFHLGGDEVDTSCWAQTPAIVSWLNVRTSKFLSPLPRSPAY